MFGKLAPIIHGLCRFFNGGRDVPHLDGRRRPMALLAVTPSSGLYFETRGSSGGLANAQFAPGFTTPVWLDLSRVGNQFTAYYSTSTASSPAPSWVQVGSP